MAMMDKSAADSYVYAKASGMLAKSYVGDRARELFSFNSLQELWSFLFKAEVPVVPEALLARALEKEAFDKANQKVMEAKSDKQKALEKRQDSMEDLIDQMAKMIIEQNKNIVGKEIAQNAIEKVNQDKAKRKGRPKKQEVEEGGTKRG